jgi:hypothetical protein
VTVEECRIQANHCLEESRKVFGSPGICAAWLKLAGYWLNTGGGWKASALTPVSRLPDGHAKRAAMTTAVCYYNLKSAIDSDPLLLVALMLTALTGVLSLLTRLVLSAALLLAGLVF